MTEDEGRKLQAQAREFAETKALCQRVRDALAAKVFETPVGAAAAREDLYTRVQALDAMLRAMDEILIAASDDKALKAYAAEIAGEKPKD